MKFKSLATLTAAIVCCLSCIESNSEMGGSLVPVDQTYQVYVSSVDLPNIKLMMADSLSGYSSSRITIGSIRDDKFGLTTRSSALTIVPLNDSLDFGDNPRVHKMHFAAAMDTTCITDPNLKNILQSVKVYELLNPIDASKDFDCNKGLSHGSERISIGTPMINGKDSLSFDFSLNFAQKFLTITQEDLEKPEQYFKKIPGIYLETSEPHGEGGRINMFELQLGYDSQQYLLTGNYARLDFTSTYKGVEKDTSFYFYYGAIDIIGADSLLTNFSRGSYPQYALNLTGHNTRSLAGNTDEMSTIYFEGGGGLKPVFSASMLRDLACEMILEKADDYKGVVINRATLELPFDFPDDYTQMDRYPYILSPTCRLMTDSTATFMNLTDSSNQNENQGNIDRSNLKFAPDITYHLQELVKINENDKLKMERLTNGSYDIWMLISANEVTTSSSSSSSSNDMSEYYQYLAYQSYYNNMYGGYGGYGGYGYGGYGYGGYGNSYYSNYYTYMMMAAYANNSNNSTTSTTQMLDKDRYYMGWLNGPNHSQRRPRLILTFSVPNKAR